MHNFIEPLKQQVDCSKYQIIVFDMTQDSEVKRLVDAASSAPDLPSLACLVNEHQASLAQIRKKDSSVDVMLLTKIKIRLLEAYQELLFDEPLTLPNPIQGFAIVILNDSAINDETLQAWFMQLGDIMNLYNYFSSARKIRVKKIISDKLFL